VSASSRVLRYTTFGADSRKGVGGVGGTVPLVPRRARRPGGARRRPRVVEATRLGQRRPV